MSSMVIAPKSFMESLCTHPSPGSLVVLQNHWFYRGFEVWEGEGRNPPSDFLQVLASFKKLHRTRQLVFRGDVETLEAGRLKINEEFSKHKDLTSQEEITKHLTAAEEANEYLKTMIVQAKYNPERDAYEINVQDKTKMYDNMPFHGGDNSEKFRKRKERRSKNKATEK